MFTISFGTKPKASPSTGPKAGRKKAAKPPTDTGTAIALAMAAVGSVLDGSTVVPFVNRPLADLQAKAEGLRPNGTFGAWYPACHEVADIGDRQAATEWLKSKGQRPKGTPKPKASTPESQPAELAELLSMKAELSALLGIAKTGGLAPAVAEGHTMVPAVPAEPETELALLAKGQIVGFADSLYEVAVDKNGKPFFRLSA